MFIGHRDLGDKMKGSIMKCLDEEPKSLRMLFESPSSWHLDYVHLPTE